MHRMHKARKVIHIFSLSLDLVLEIINLSAITRCEIRIFNCSLSYNNNMTINFRRIGHFQRIIFFYWRMIIGTVAS